MIIVLIPKKFNLICVDTASKALLLTVTYGFERLAVRKNTFSLSERKYALQTAAIWYKFSPRKAQAWI